MNGEDAIGCLAVTRDIAGVIWTVTLTIARDYLQNRMLYEDRARTF